MNKEFEKELKKVIGDSPFKDELLKKHRPLIEAIDIKDNIYEEITTMINKHCFKERKIIQKHLIKRENFRGSEDEKKLIEEKEKIRDFMKQLKLEVEQFRKENKI